MTEYQWEQADRHNPWGKKRIRGSHCSKGHEFTKENTFIRAYDNARVCRECRKQYAREKYQRNKLKNGGIARPKKEKPQVFETPESAILLDKAHKPWYTLQEAMKDLTVKDVPCKQEPHYYVDYPENVSEDFAEELCSGCPLLKQCYDFAVASEQKWGVWGGINFTTKEMIYGTNKH
jgi:hypothetical protein